MCSETYVLDAPCGITVENASARGCGSTCIRLSRSETCSDRSTPHFRIRSWSVEPQIPKWNSKGLNFSFEDIKPPDAHVLCDTYVVGQPDRPESLDVLLTMPKSTEMYRCSICQKVYKRREHLQRHVSSHSSERPHRCNSCGVAFQRPDVLRRHIQTCDATADRVATGAGRRRACDRCVRQKKACNCSLPCQNCKKRASPCQYSFTSQKIIPEEEATLCDAAPAESESVREDEMSVQPADENSANPDLGNTQFGDFNEFIINAYSSFNFSDNYDMSWDDFLQLMPDTRPSSEPTFTRPADAGYSFHFLYHFTSKTGLVNSFDCGTAAQRQQVADALLQTEYTDQSESGGPLTSGGPLVVEEQLALTTETMGAPSSLIMSPPWLHDPLVVKTYRIILQIKETVTVKPRNSSVLLVWSTALEQQCLQFFSPKNVRKFLALYWAIWHPNVNLIHRPTFDPTQSKSTLLAAMALLGKLSAS